MDCKHEIVEIWGKGVNQIFCRDCNKYLGPTDYLTRAKIKEEKENET